MSSTWENEDGLDERRWEREMQRIPRGTGPTGYDEIPAMNWSLLKYGATSMKLLKHRIEHDRPDTDALRQGRAIHCAVFEPERWESAYVCGPDVDLRTNAGKAERAAWLAAMAGEGFLARPDFGDQRKKANKQARDAWEAGVPDGVRVIVGTEDASEILPGVEVLSAREHELAEQCASAVRGHPRAAALLRGGRAEEAVTWTDPETGVRCKGRIDWIRPISVLDLKSTRQPTIPQMANDVARFLYHGQMAWYHDGAIAAGLIPADAERPWMIFVKTSDDFDVVPAQLAPDAFGKGRRLYRQLLQRWKASQASNFFPGLAPDVVQMDTPHWAAGDPEPNDEDW